MVDAIASECDVTVGKRAKAGIIMRACYVPNEATYCASAGSTGIAWNINKSVRTTYCLVKQRVLLRLSPNGTVCGQRHGDKSDGNNLEKVKVGTDVL